MVYNGVPSGGCYLCRSRKIKCDEAKPYCNRCRKSKRQCPGYPVLTKTHARAYAESRRPTRNGIALLSDSSSSDEEEYVTSRWIINAARKAGAAPAPLDSTIKIPLQDAAACHFLANWVLLPPPGTNRGIFEFLLPMQKNAAQGSPFYLAFKACSLSSFAQRGFDPVIERQAASYYVKALAATSDALSRPSIATSDATLATVMLLALYEIQSASTHGVQGWGSHITGSMQLMNSRSWKRLNTDLGMSIFVAVRVKLILLGLLQGKPPPTGSDWWGKGTFKDKYALVGLHLTTQTTEVRNQLEKLLDLECATMGDFAQLPILMKKFHALEEHCRKWPETLPEYFRYDIAAWVSEPPADPAEAEALLGPIHCYRGPWVVGIWNMVRTSRLILVSSILRCSAILRQCTDIRALPEYATMAERSTDVIGDIISGMPYHFGWFENRPELLPAMPSFACGQNGVQCSSLAAFFAMFPLTTMQDSDFATEEQRLFAKGRLRFMAYHIGLRSAAFVEKPKGRIPSAMLLQDYDSRSVRQWRRLRAAAAEVAPVEPLLHAPIDDPSAAPVPELAPVTISMELPIHPPSPQTNPEQGQQGQQGS